MLPHKICFFWNCRSPMKYKMWHIVASHDKNRVSINNRHTDETTIRISNHRLPQKHQQTLHWQIIQQKLDFGPFWLVNWNHEHSDFEAALETDRSCWPAAVLKSCYKIELILSLKLKNRTRSHARSLSLYLSVVWLIRYWEVVLITVHTVPGRSE